MYSGRMLHKNQFFKNPANVHGAPSAPSGVQSICDAEKMYSRHR